MPLLPSVLINGAEGIGTGYSTFIPNYNPKDLVDNVKRLMRGEPVEKMHPWYKEFNGYLVQTADGKYEVEGKIERHDEMLHITELPVFTWTQNYKEYLETLIAAGYIKDFKEYHTDKRVDFKVHFTKEQWDVIRSLNDDELKKKFKICTSLTTTNLVCFSPDSRLKKYSSAEEILVEFYDLRIKYYQKRKEHLTNVMTNEWNKLDNRSRFIKEIIEGSLVIQKRKRDDIVNDLEKRNYAKFFNDLVVEDGNSELKGGYDYLLSMPLWSLTKERVEALENDKKTKEGELNALLKKSPKDLWNDDLEAFLEKWEAELKGGDTTMSVRVALKNKRGVSTNNSKMPSIQNSANNSPEISRAASPLTDVDESTLTLQEKISRMLARQSQVGDLTKKLGSINIEEKKRKGDQVNVKPAKKEKKDTKKAPAKAVVPKKVTKGKKKDESEESSFVESEDSIKVVKPARKTQKQKKIVIDTESETSFSEEESDEVESDLLESEESDVPKKLAKKQPVKAVKAPVVKKVNPQPAKAGVKKQTVIESDSDFEAPSKGNRARGAVNYTISDDSEEDSDEFEPSE
jgi:DNA topoisomerase-2